MEEFSVEASTGVQQDTQALESLPVFKMVPCEQMMELMTVYITFTLESEAFCEVLRG